MQLTVTATMKTTTTSQPDNAITTTSTRAEEESSSLIKNMSSMNTMTTTINWSLPESCLKVGAGSGSSAPTSRKACAVSSLSLSRQQLQRPQGAQQPFASTTSTRRSSMQQALVAASESHSNNQDKHPSEAPLLEGTSQKQLRQQTGAPQPTSTASTSTSTSSSLAHNNERHHQQQANRSNQSHSFHSSLFSLTNHSQQQQQRAMSLAAIISGGSQRLRPTSVLGAVGAYLLVLILVTGICRCAPVADTRTSSTTASASPSSASSSSSAASSPSASSASVRHGELVSIDNSSSDELRATTSLGSVTTLQVPSASSLRRLFKRSGISDQRLAEIQMIRALKKQLERASKIAASSSTNLALADTDSSTTT